MNVGLVHIVVNGQVILNMTKKMTVVVTENNGTENPETTTETSGNLPNNNNTTPKVNGEKAFNHNG